MTAQRLNRLQQTEESARPKLLDGNFPAQEAFIMDSAKLKVLLCTRRSGKSYGAGLYLYQTALDTPGASCLFLALTRESVKKILWKDILKPISRKFKLRVKFNESDLTATLPNGSIIYLLGVDSTEDEKRKLLGQKYPLVIIDEAAQYSIDLQELVYGILKPAVADYRGTICLIGTPSNLKRGLYYDLTNGQDAVSAGRWEKNGWSGHRWSALDNPHMREKWQAEIADLKRDNPRITETPLFQQHYLGKWVIDDTQLVYRYQPGRNDCSARPEHPKGAWHYVLGVDLGYEDPTAFSVCAYHDHDKSLYVLESSKEAKLDVSAVAEKIRRYCNRYEFERILIDNSNKQAVAEMVNRHDLNLSPADKAGKSDFIELMNAEFILGHILLEEKACTPLIEEYGNLIWDKSALEKRNKREEHPGCDNHCTDATLYAWRYCYPYLSEKWVAPPKPGTREFIDITAVEMYEREVEAWRIREENKREQLGDYDGVGDSSKWDERFLN